MTLKYLKRLILTIHSKSPSAIIFVSCLISQSIFLFLGYKLTTLNWCLLVGVGGAVLGSLAFGQRLRLIRFFAIGFFFGAITAIGIEAPDSEQEENPYKGSFLVKVMSEPDYSMTGAVSFIGESLEKRDRILIRTVHLPWRNSELIRQGMIVSVNGAFKLINPIRPWSYDATLLRKGIRYNGRAHFVSTPLYIDTSFISKSRRWIESRAAKIFQEIDHEGGALLLSMSFGFEDGISNYTEGLFKSTGLMHLMVVSGVQVVLIFFLIKNFLHILFVRFSSWNWSGSIDRLTVPPSLIGALYYVLITGSEDAGIRAMVATLIVCVAGLVGFRVGIFNLTLLVGTVLMLVTPGIFFDISFELTFAALFGIALGLNILPQYKRTKVKTYFLCTLFATLATSIVTYLRFGTLAPLGWIANIIFAAPFSYISCNIGIPAFIFSGVTGVSWPTEIIAILLSESIYALEWFLSLQDNYGTAINCTICAILLCLWKLRFTVD